MNRILALFVAAYTCDTIRITKCDDKVFDCEQPVCKPKVKMLLKSMENFKRNQKANTKIEDNFIVEKAPNNMNSAITFPTYGCPIDRDELGRSTWNLLHTIATYYPDNPTIEQKMAMIQFIKGLAEFYPCGICRSDFYSSISTTDFSNVVLNRESLSIFICNLHNEVNTKLNKPLFSCRLESLDERWRKSINGNCDEIENMDADKTDE